MTGMRDEVKPSVAVSPLARRQRAVLSVAVLAALAATGGLIASTLVKSPSQVASETRPPDPSVLTAEVVHRKLSATLVMRGTYSTGRRHTFTPTGVAASANGPGGQVLVVTGVRSQVGAQVVAGGVVLEVSERPVFALTGAFPAYRDILPGQTGKDIEQLRDGLTKLGFRSYDRRGYFGPSTGTAVKRFYNRIGYPVPLAPATPPTSAPAPAAPEPEPQPMVPKSEVAFLPALPARVAALGAGVGGAVKDPLITFSTGGISLTARADPRSTALIAVGMQCGIVAEATSFTGTGQVAEVGLPTTDEVPATEGPTAAGPGAAAYIPVLVTRAEPWPEQLAATDVRVTITTAGTKDAVLAVPQAAVSATADGRTWVTVVAADGGQRVVDVTAGVSADGFVEVTPNSGELRAGERVVTGR